MTWAAAAIAGSAAVGAGTNAALANQQVQNAKSGRFVSGGADERIYATRDFKSIFGRDPTESELSQIIPAYIGADQHIPDLAGGKAYIASLYQARKDIPALGATQKQQTEDLASKQFGQNQDFINSDMTSRATGREALVKLLTQQAQQSFQQTLPKTAEDYNAGHLLDSSGYGNEVARQQSYLASQIANQVGLQGLNDIDTSSTQRAQALAQMQGMNANALQTGQGFDTAALNREFSLQDFQRQANLSLALGQSASPQVGGGSGKGSLGTTLSGVGALAPLITAFTQRKPGNPVTPTTAGVNGASSRSGGGKS